jgi:hypothetical protein
MLEHDLHALPSGVLPTSVAFGRAISTSLPEVVFLVVVKAIIALALLTFALEGCSSDRNPTERAGRSANAANDVGIKKTSQQIQQAAFGAR